MVGQILVEKVFAPDDQERFAQISGDWNPLHIDALAARRTQFGMRLVHGMHMVLRCLEGAALEFGSLAPAALKVRFLKPVYVGELMTARIVSSDQNELRIQVEVDGVKVATLRLSLSGEPTGVIDDGRWDVQPVTTVARDLDFEALNGRRGEVAFAASPGAIGEAFPEAGRWLGRRRLAALAGLSRLVGMECPGTHSLFSALAVDFRRSGDGSELSFAVTDTDVRFRSVKMKVAAKGFAGTVEAFFRAPPVAQSPIGEIAKRVGRDEFRGQCALIVGGSRGLGEVVAKIIAAGGGHPIITYSVGRAEAEGIARELTNWGALCEVMRFDVREPALAQLTAMMTAPMQLYYFATSPISRRKGRSFDSALFQEFIAFYVDGFNNICAALQSRWGSNFVAFYPSSVAIDERPENMTEYAMAKAAGEILCADLPNLYPGVRVIRERLPRMPTDLTATILAGTSVPAIDVLLPLVRLVQEAGVTSNPGTAQADSGVPDTR